VGVISRSHQPEGVSTSRENLTPLQESRRPGFLDLERFDLSESSLLSICSAAVNLSLFPPFGPVQVTLKPIYLRNICSIASSASRTKSRTIWAAGLTSWIRLHDSPA